MFEMITGFGLGCLSVLTLIVGRDFGHLAVARVFILTLFTCAVFLIHPFVHSEWKWLSADIMTMVPAMFWFLCQMAFAHRARFNRIWVMLALYSFVAPALTRPFIEADSAGQLMDIIGWQIPRNVEYLLILHGLWVVIANWSDDLVESRRQLRVVVLAVVGIAALLVTLTLNMGLGDYWVLSLMTAAASMAAIYFLLQGRVGALLGPATEVVPADVEDPEVPVSQETSVGQALPAALEEESLMLNQLMQDGFYRTEKLTLSILAEALQLPEYKTRALINQRLGYRNFNDYINQLRISEAAQRLLAEPDTPVLNISLDVGYRSLSSFNRAFKENLALSPSAYRQQHGVENAN